MCEIDEVMLNIESGMGLEPLDPNSIDNITDGVSIEQRGLTNGNSAEIFSLNESKTENE